MNITEDVPVNWSQLARKYGIKDTKGNAAKNGGQIAKTYAQSIGLDVNKFKNCKRKSNSSTITIRRAKKKCYGGDITVPTDPPSSVVKTLLAEKVEKGEYTLGELIVPRKYFKMVLQNGKLQSEEFIVEGRKISLKDIRIKLLKKHKPYMRIQNDHLTEMKLFEVQDLLNKINEWNDNDSDSNLRLKLQEHATRRNLQIWHDASVISNYGHILFTVNTLYDPAVYYTDQEYFLKTGKLCNVQTIIEQPEIYIVGRCRANDEQLSYVEIRLDCLSQLNQLLLLENDVKIKDTMRLFHGDGPAAQLEAGQQKGGNYYCPVCEISAHRCNDIAHSYYCDNISLQEKKRQSNERNLWT